MNPFLFFLFFISCTFVAPQHQNEDAIYSVHAYRILPIHGPDAKLTAYDTSFSNVYFRGKAKIYDFTLKNYNSENGILVSTEVWHRYVLATGDSSFGIEFNSHSVPQKRRAPLDSLFMNEWICSNGELMNGKSQLISSRKDPKAGTLLETYKLKDQTDSNFTLTCELLFTDILPWLQLPYNKAVNEKRKMQLIRTTFKAKSQFYKPFNRVLEGYNVTFAFTEVSASNKDWDRLLKYFQ